MPVFSQTPSRRGPAGPRETHTPEPAKTRRDLWFGLALAITAGFAVFWLPFLLPPAQAPVVSASLAAGFNNRVAAVSAALLALASFAFALRFGGATRAPRGPQNTLSNRTLLVGAGALTLWYLLLGTIGYLGDLRIPAESRYFIVQMKTASTFHLRLYRDVEFAYGPLLFYPPILLKPLFAFAAQPLQAAYLLVLFVCEFIGSLLVGWSLNQLPISRSLRVAFFVLLLALGAVDFGLGLNYTLLRFISPMVSLLICTRKGRDPWRTAALLFVAELVNLGISPEMGIAFAAGAGSYALLKARRGDRRFLLVSLAPGAALLSFLAVFGMDYFAEVRAFSAGVYNFIVEPQWYMLVFLLASLWLAPRGVAARWRDKDEQSATWVALFISGLALVPAAFGRADNGHVLLNGLAILLLSLITVSGWSQRAQYAWAGAIALSVCLVAAAVLGGGYIAVYYHMIGIATRQHIPPALARKLLPERVAAKLAKLPTGSPDFDPSALRALTQGAPIATPQGLLPPDQDALFAAGLATPNYYLFLGNDFTLQSEQRTMAEMDRQKWLMLPHKSPIIVRETPEGTQYLLGFKFPYHTHHPVYGMGELINRDLNDHWQQVASYGSVVLYRHR